jgi:hypothetical protein
VIFRRGFNFFESGQRSLATGTVPEVLAIH